MKAVVARGGRAPQARRLHRRRVAELRPAGLAGRAHDLGLVAGGHGLPEPAGVDVQDGRRHHGALGRLLPALQGLGVPQPLRARCRSTARTCSTGRSGWPTIEPYYDRAEDKLGVTRTNGIPGLPANNNFKVMGNGGKRAGYKDVSTGPHGDQHACRATGGRRRFRTASTSRVTRKRFQVEHPRCGRTARPRPPACSIFGPEQPAANRITELSQTLGLRAVLVPHRQGRGRCNVQRAPGVVAVAGELDPDPLDCCC